MNSIKQGYIYILLGISFVIFPSQYMTTNIYINSLTLLEEKCNMNYISQIWVYPFSFTNSDNYDYNLILGENRANLLDINYIWINNQDLVVTFNSYYNAYEYSLSSRKEDVSYFDPRLATTIQNQNKTTSIALKGLPSSAYLYLHIRGKYQENDETKYTEVIHHPIQYNPMVFLKRYSLSFERESIFNQGTFFTNGVWSIMNDNTGSSANNSGIGAERIAVVQYNPSWQSIRYKVNLSVGQSFIPGNSFSLLFKYDKVMRNKLTFQYNSIAISREDGGTTTALRTYSPVLFVPNTKYQLQLDIQENKDNGMNTITLYINGDIVLKDIHAIGKFGGVGVDTTNLPVRIYSMEMVKLD